MKTRVLHFRPEGGNEGGDAADAGAAKAASDAAAATAAQTPEQQAAADKAAADAAAAAAAAAQTPEQKAAAEKAAAEKATADAAAAEKAATEKAAAEKLTALHTPPADGNYTLTLPKDSTLDASVIERTAAIARTLGLSNDAAQSLVDSTQAEVTQYLTAEHAKFEAAAEEWKKTALANPEFGKTPEERRQAIDKGRQVIDVHYTKVNPEGATALKTFLNDSAYGNHPAVVSFMHWLGKQGAEGPLVLPNAGGGGTGELPIKDVFYPKGAGRTEAEVAADG